MKLKHLYIRDKGICQICLEPVAKNAKATGSWGPSADHILPKSLGGTRADHNLRLAHRKCNSKRGNSPDTGFMPRPKTRKGKRRQKKYPYSFYWLMLNTERAWRDDVIAGKLATSQPWRK